PWARRSSTVSPHTWWRAGAARLPADAGTTTDDLRRRAGSVPRPHQSVHARSPWMTKYLISFPSRAMEVADDEWELVGRESHAVLRLAKDAGVWVFGGGIEESVAPVRVAGNGTVIEGAYPENERLSGGFALLELPSRDEALEWAARFAVSCRCPQEVWEFIYDPES